MRLLFACIAIVSLAACAKPKDLDFIDIQNVRMVKMGLTESQVGLDIRFYNPNNQRAQLRNAEAKVYVNSTYLGDTRTDATIPVPRRDTFAIPLLLNIKTMSAVSKVMQALSDSTVLIRIEGTVQMGKAGVFKSFPVVYEKVQRVSELTGKIEM